MDLFPKINSVSDLRSMTEAEKDELLVRFSRKHHYLVDSVINLLKENEKLIRENKKLELLLLAMKFKLTNNTITRDIELPEPKSPISKQQSKYDVKDLSLDKNEDYDEKCEEKKPRPIFDGKPLLTLADKIRIAMGLAPDPIQSLDKNEDYDEKCEEKKPRPIFDGNPVLTLVTEKKFYKKTRIVQKEFRENLIKYWNGKCAVTGFEKIELLKASHIKPWKDSKDSNEFERRDKFNGLLLAPGLDSAFDKGYISFSEIDGSMLISDELNKNKEMLGIVAEYPKLSKLDEKHKLYLRYHLKHVYQKWRK